MLEIQVHRVELDRVYRVDKPREVEASSKKPSPSIMTVKLSGYGTKMKFMKAREDLRGEQIYRNEDLAKANHDFPLQVKKSCADRVAIYTVKRE